MVATGQDSSQHYTLARLQLVMFLRVTLVSFLLGVAIIIQVRETKTYLGEILNAHYFLIGLIYFLTFVYVVALKHIKSYSRFAYLQILFDTVFITAIIYTTGGIESMFSFLYLLNIISGGIILYRRGGVMIASFALILYGALLDFHYYGLIDPMGPFSFFPQDYQSSAIFYRILVNGAAFYMVAFFSSFLSEQIRKSATELRAQQKDIANLEILKENIIQSVSSGLVALDEDGRIMVFNRGAETMFHVDSKDAIHKNVKDVIPFIMTYLDGKGLHRLNQISFQRSDGQKIEFLLNVSPLSEQDGAARGKILFFQDMTRLRKMEREVKRMEDLALVGELAAGIAHEIRNPLASISGSIQILHENLSSNDGRNDQRLMEIVLREINRLNHLVNDFLQFARPKNMQARSFALDKLIADTLDLFQNSQRWSQQLVVATEFEDSARKIESDPEQLKQILWNIFLNAAEAMPRGGCLRVRTEKTQDLTLSKERSDSVSIVVEDSGPGIDSKVIKDIFEPFSTTKADGSGLGLAIVKRIVEGLGGKVSGKNLPDEGAAITIILPLSWEGR